jgi:hypothetical protein
MPVDLGDSVDFHYLFFRPFVAFEESVFVTKRTRMNELDARNIINAFLKGHV